MAVVRYDVEKFTGKNDFGLWRIKMKALLTLQGLAAALKGDDGGTTKSTDVRKIEMMEKAHSAIILCLGDRVLREVSREKSAAAVWSKLESLYMAKSLANRLYLKRKLLTFKLLDDEPMDDQLEEFNKIIFDLENVEAPVENEDQAFILLNALPESYKLLKDAMLYDTDLTVEEVQGALRVMEMQKVFVKGKLKKPWQQRGEEGEEKETRRCHYCEKPGHLKKDCYAFKRKQGVKGQKQESGDVAEELNVVEWHI